MMTTDEGDLAAEVQRAIARLRPRPVEEVLAARRLTMQRAAARLGGAPVKEND